ncbi:MAG: chalcone isomerase family protein [Proteobacteria bacterium]|nr:chalcone isomerase family protein [Pseudomonadota bacterium]
MKHLLLTTILALALCSTALSAELEGVTLPDSMDTDGSALVLNGMAQRSVLWIDVYVAGLYLPAKTADADSALAMDGPKRMDMVFQRDVESADICKAWKEGFEKNADGGGEAVMPTLDALCAATPDLKVGDTMAYIYTASTDTTDFILNGTSTFSAPGKDFYTALLSCWIGPKPGPGKSFKKGVLGLD